MKPPKAKREKDRYICPTDDSTTRIARGTTCCGGEHQTIAGALLKSEWWKKWYKHASREMLFDVDETYGIDAMSDRHFEAFIEYVRSRPARAKKR